MGWNGVTGVANDRTLTVSGSLVDPVDPVRAATEALLNEVSLLRRGAGDPGRVVRAVRGATLHVEAAEPEGGGGHVLQVTRVEGLTWLPVFSGQQLAAYVGACGRGAEQVRYGLLTGAELIDNCLRELPRGTGLVLDPLAEHAMPLPPLAGVVPDELAIDSERGGVMSGSDEFGVDLDALAQAEKGVRDAVAELGEVIGWLGGGFSSEGHGVGELALSEGQTGHTTLAMATKVFTDKWDWGVKVLIEDGTAAADALGETRSTYEQVEDGVASSLKYLAHVVAGDPMQDSGAWQDRSFSEIVYAAAPDYLNDPMEKRAGYDADGDGHVGGKGGQ